MMKSIVKEVLHPSTTKKIYIIQLEMKKFLVSIFYNEEECIDYFVDRTIPILKNKT